jgi:hypothetical protein
VRLVLSSGAFYLPNKILAKDDVVEIDVVEIDVVEIDVV